MRVTTSAARRSEPGCSPWSTVMPPARMPSLGASKARAEASAMESAPPEQATRTSGRGPPARRWPAGLPVWSVRTSWSTRRTARRIAATAGWGPMSGALRWSSDASEALGWCAGVLLPGCPRGTGGCHSECVDGDRTERFPEHRTPFDGPRSLGRVTLLPPVRHVYAPCVTPLRSVRSPCGAPGPPSRREWRSRPWSAVCSERSTPG